MKSWKLLVVFLVFCRGLHAQPTEFAIDPGHVAFKYNDPATGEEEFSHWIPGAMEFWTDATYAEGSALTTRFLDLYTNAAAMRLDTASLTFGRFQAGPFIERIRLDYDGLHYLNGASWPGFDLHLNGLGGQLDLYTGYNSNAVARLGSTSAGSGRGRLVLYDVNGYYRQYHAVAADEFGYSWWRGKNGTGNIYLGISHDAPSDGRIIVYNENNRGRAGIRIDTVGKIGVVWGDVKAFRMDHPEDPSQEIWYASVEGPEVAAYERGTAELKNGRATVGFSEHFSLIANPETMTVMVTCLYSDTYGLAVVEKSAQGFSVEELKEKKGNFLFDWEVKCIRKGYEQWQVERPKEALPKLDDEEDSNNSRRSDQSFRIMLPHFETVVPDSTCVRDH